MANSVEMEAKAEGSAKAGVPSDTGSVGLTKRHKTLTSPILSPQDINQEILERSKRKHLSQPPTTSDSSNVVFTMKLTQRLAKKVVRENVRLEVSEEKTPDLDARELLSILQDGAETHYLDGVRPPKTARLSRGPYSRTDSKIDPELEKQLALKQLMEFSRKRGRPKKESNNNEVKETAKEAPMPLGVIATGKPKNRELEKLLQDEGAINMLYAIEKGGEEATKPSLGLLPSKRRMKKALIKKAQEVKEAILGGASAGLNLRYRVPEKSRKPSVDSVDSEVEAFSPQLPAEASKIIRRHSSSSSYSSRSNSPSRRASIERDKSPHPPEATLPTSNGIPSPEFLTPHPPQPSSKSIAERLIEKKCKELKLRPDQSDIFRRLIRQNGFGLKERLQTELKAAMSVSLKESPNISSSCQQVGPESSVQSKEASLEAKTNDAIWKMVEEDWLTDDVELSLPPGTSTPKPITVEQVLQSSDVSRMTSMKQIGDTLLRSELSMEGDISLAPYVRQLDSCSHGYKELRLKRVENLVHVDIAPVSTYLPQAFNSQVLRELTTLLEELSLDVKCRALLVTCCSSQAQISDTSSSKGTSGGIPSGNKLFSNGLDLPALLHQNLEIRKNVASEMATALKQFVCKLCMMRKVVVAGVDGDAVGLGTVLLAYCDVVLATDRSTFSTPYTQLGYLPEAAATLALPHAVGTRCASNMLLGCARLSATDALKCGLVTKVLPIENFQEELINFSLPLSRQSSQSVESTKALLMHGVRTRLGSVLALEASLLQQHWTSEECQARIRAWAKHVTTTS